MIEKGCWMYILMIKEHPFRFVHTKRSRYSILFVYNCETSLLCSSPHSLNLTLIPLNNSFKLVNLTWVDRTTFNSYDSREDIHGTATTIPEPNENERDQLTKTTLILVKAIIHFFIKNYIICRSQGSRMYISRLIPFLWCT